MIACLHAVPPLPAPRAWLFLLLAPSIAIGDDAPRDHEAACWLWPGAQPLQCGAATRIYVLQGHFHRDGYFEPQGPGPGRVPRTEREIVPVYRMDALPPNGALREIASPSVFAWRRQGWRVPGLQVDFDSPTTRLDRYARWVDAENALFRSIGGATRITSVTGLGDWLMAGRPEDLRALGVAAGTIAFMFYHRGRGIEPVNIYVDALGRSSLRFRVGVLPTQRQDRRLAVLRDAPGYRGDIVFQGLRVGSTLVLSPKG